MATDTTSAVHSLLPCPFCGGAARRSSSGKWHGTGCSGSMKCPAHLHALMFHTPEESDAAWNHRAQPMAPAVVEPLTADGMKEPKNGQHWRVEWWNESCRMMLPTNKKLDRCQSFKNGTMMFTIKQAAHGIGIKDGDSHGLPT